MRPKAGTVAVLVAALALSLAPAQAQNDQEAERLAAQVDRRYNNLRTMQAKFVESFRGAGMRREESGTLLLKRPGKMRWDYEQPRTKVFLTDGRTAYFYVPGERQARKTSMRRLDDLRSPLRYLLGRSRLNREFDNLTIARDAQPMAGGNVILRGVPKRMEDRIEQVLLEISPEHQIVRIYIEEVDGSRTEFRFSEVRENLEVPDSRFRLSLPRDVEVVEGTELEP